MHYSLVPIFVAAARVEAEDLDLAAVVPRVDFAVLF